MMIAWDYSEKRTVEVGSRRFVARRYELREGHRHDEACEEGTIEDCFEMKQRVFPSRGLALAFARDNPGCWGASADELVVEQVFLLEYRDEWKSYGVWEDMSPGKKG